MGDYDLESIRREINARKAELKHRIDIQVLFKIMIENGIVSREDIEKHRQEVHKIPGIRQEAESLAKDSAAWEHYSTDQGAYIRDIYNSKLNRAKRDMDT